MIQLVYIICFKGFRQTHCVSFVYMYITDADRFTKLSGALKASTNIAATYVREEPAVTCRWTGWVWEITGWRVTDHLEESMEYTSNEWKQNRKMPRCNRLELESLESWLTCPKTSWALAWPATMMTQAWLQLYSYSNRYHHHPTLFLWAWDIDISLACFWLLRAGSLPSDGDDEIYEAWLAAQLFCV